MPPFTFSHDVQLRYRDLDPNGHVNHAVYATCFEDARTAYWQTVVDEPLAEAGVAIVSLSIDYEAELDLDMDPTVVMRIDPIGRSSIPQVYELRVEDRRVARANAVMVAFDRDRRRSRPVPERWRAAIAGYEAAHGNDWADR